MAPNLFGDFYSLGGSADVGRVSSTSALVPLAAGCGRLSIADNNNALTRDRVYFAYNHFHNPLQADPDWTGRSGVSIDRYLFGVEKSLADGLWSVELRMPFASNNEPNVTQADASIAFDTGHVGNLALILKRVLCSSDVTVVSAGLGVTVPTGNDVTVRDYMGPLDVVLESNLRNRAVNLIPYIGWTQTPTPRFFWQGFLQLDVAANPNRYTYRYEYDDGSTSYVSTDSGDVLEKTLLHFDVGAGYWLYRNPSARLFTGLASVAELHYTTSLQREPAYASDARLDISDVTIGLHGEFHKMLCRVGGAFPLRTAAPTEEGVVDAEVIVQLEWRF